MVEHTGSKATGFMTDTAILGGGHVIHRFADSGCAMAGGAVIHNPGVIKHRTNKGSGVMTDATILGGSNVRTRLANGGGAIVAGGATITDTGVVEYRG